jgi:hypothetical protein
VRPVTSAPLLLSAFVLTGCITVPRSAGLGMTASPLGAGRTEVGLSSGLAILSESEPPSTTNFLIFTQTDWTTRAGASPLAEANVHHGLNDWLGLNLHVSQAGVQPGLKVTLLERAVTLGLMPEVGFGLLGGSTGQTVFQGSSRTDTPPVSELRWAFNAGGRFLLSHPGSGVYGGVGYQLQLAGVMRSQRQGAEELMSSATSHTLHNVQAAFGWEVTYGSVRVRPELAAVITPDWTVRERNGTTELGRGGGNGFLLFPNVTFALVSERARTLDEDEDEAPRRGRGKGRRAPPRSDEEDLDDPAFRR